MSGLIWKDDTYAAERLEAAIAGSKSAILRVQGIKIRAQMDPPTQMDLSLRFPFPGHRTVAEWI